MKKKPQQKSISVILAFGMGFLLYLATAYAEVIHGEVKTVDPENNSFQIKRLNVNFPRVAEEMNVTVNANTRFDGLDSLKDLTMGDEVSLDAEKVQGGKWQAASITISKVKIHQVTPQPDPALAS